MTTKPSRLLEHPVPEGDPNPKTTRCRVCGEEVSNYYMQRVQHGRMHVLKGEAVEVVDDSDRIIFGIIASAA